MLIRRLSWTLGIAGLLLAPACNGNGGSNTSMNGGSTAGAINVRLVDSPTSAFQEIDLDIQQVQIHQSGSAGESGWINLGAPNRVVNLLALQGGVVETLVAGAGLPPGTYQQLRLVLGTRNHVVLLDGSSADLTVPSGMQTGVKIPGSFTVSSGTTADVFIDFDAAHSIQIHAAGPNHSYMLRPVVFGFDKAVTGSISGTLTTSSGIPLAGVEAMAEQVDASGNVTIARMVRTSATGSYQLDLLPLGGTYFVVSLPASGTAVYQAKASDGITLTTAQPTQVYSASFLQADSTGSLGGTITPALTTGQADTLLVLQAFGSRWLVVMDVNVTAAAPETYLVAGLPTGAYRTQLLRSTLNADGSSSLGRSVLSPAALVATGLTTTLNLNFP